MNIAVYQLSVVRTLLFFVGLILWTDDKYDYGDVSTDTCLTTLKQNLPVAIQYKAFKLKHQPNVISLGT